MLADSQGNGTSWLSSWVHHVLLLQIKPDAPSLALQELMRQIRQLKDLIPEVLELTLGDQDDVIYSGYQKRHSDMTHGAVITLRNSEALATYMTHPEHLRVAQHIKSW